VKNTSPTDTPSADTDSRDEFAPGDDRRRHHRGPRGRGPGFGPGFGPWGGRGPWGPPRGPRRERGDVRAAILLLLAEQPRHGYEILTEISDRSDGRWQPSPGSIYPVLKRLARDGLVRPEHENGKRIFTLTDEGRTVVETEKDGWGEPWNRAEDSETDASMELFAEGKQLGAAVWQVSQGNDPEQIEATKAILAEARKKIYGVLAQ
jgi:DNA-binding PadR family transcriptional regulator